MMRYGYLLFAVVCVGALSGCVTLRYDRIGSYQALPVPSSEFEALSAYTIAFVPKPFQLHVSERGSAWLLLVRGRGGAVTQAVAVAFDERAVATDELCPASVGRLLAILPGDPDQFEDARGILVAHDGRTCYVADESYRCSAADVWSRAPVIDRIAVTSREANSADAALRTWYEARLTSAMVRAKNTSLSEEEWGRLRWEESAWKDVAEAAPPAVGGAVVAGLFAGVIPGIVVGGVAFAVRFPQLFFERDRGPEYGDAPMPAAVVAEYAEYLRRCGNGRDVRTARTE